MKFSTKLMTALSAGVILFAACNKDDKDDNNVTPTTKTKKEYLLEGKWQITGFTSVSHYKDSTNGIDTTFTNDQIDEMEPCEKDNFLTFMANGKIHADEGAVKCDATDPQIDSASAWVLNDDFSKLTITEPGDPAQIFNFDEANSTTLKMSMIDEGVDGTATYKTTLTITAKNIK